MNNLQFYIYSQKVRWAKAVTSHFSSSSFLAEYHLQMQIHTRSGCWLIASQRWNYETKYKNINEKEQNSCIIFFMRSIKFIS